jgi:hypothetical protein
MQPMAANCSLSQFCSRAQAAAHLRNNLMALGNKAKLTTPPHSLSACTKQSYVIRLLRCPLQALCKCSAVSRPPIYAGNSGKNESKQSLDYCSKKSVNTSAQRSACSDVGCQPAASTNVNPSPVNKSGR